MEGHVFTNEERMMESRRLLALAAALNLTLGIGVGSAQTVLVRNAPPDSTIEVVHNDAPVGSAKADASGIATIPVDLSGRVKKTETDAQIFVDVCDAVRRVLIAERAVVPPSQEPGCVRRDMGGIFLVRQVSTLVVDFGGSSPTLMLRQGRVSLEPARSWSAAPRGLVLFGGGAFTKASNAGALACGTLTECSSSDSGIGYTAGAEYWITEYLAAEGGYIRPAEATAEGSGDTFRFDNTFKAHVVTAAGKVGVPVGPVRIYGKVGGTYTRATFATTQIMEETTVTVGGATQTIPGGTQSYGVKTVGWSWLFGGGMEVWVAPSFAVYGEFGRAALKGVALDEDEEGTLDERLTSIFFGARIRIGG
jgi:hypothetical protein